MASKTFFFTGFPGFLCSETLPLILNNSPDATAALLIQKKFRPLAEAKLKELNLSHRSVLVEGDLLENDLGLTFEQMQGLCPTIDQIFHYAAVYDLSVERDFAYKVNVEGTKRVLDFAKQCSALTRFQYVSTCYVSGRHSGDFSERDLVKGQSFNNYYEETKHIAEVEVQKSRAAGLPVVIFRPAIVVGNSKTGATQKFDGPYYVIRWILRQRGIALLPKIGDPTVSTLNLVPSDFVVEAIAKLSQHPRAVGQVFHLADPKALTIQKVVELIARTCGRKVVNIPLPASLTKATLEAKGLRSFFKIPGATIDYFVHPTQYKTDLTTPFLKDVGLSVPPLDSYMEKLVDYLRKHPDTRAEAMV